MPRSVRSPSKGLIQPAQHLPDLLGWLAPVHRNGLERRVDRVGLERIARLAARMFDAPMALVVLSQAGETIASFSNLDGFGSNLGPSEHALLADAPVVLDAADDPRCSAFAWVNTAPHIRFLAGAPLVAPGEVKLGSLCIMDTKPRLKFDAWQREALEDLAATVVAELQRQHTGSIIEQLETQGHQSTTQLQALLTALPDLVFCIDRHGRYLSAHGRPDLFFKPPETFLGQSIQEVLPAHVANQAMQAIQTTLETGEMQRFEYRLPLADGLHTFEARVLTSSSDQVIAVIRDLTELRQATAEAEARNAFALQVMEAMGQGLTVTDEQGCFEYVNPAYAKLLGTTQEALVGRQPFDVAFPEERLMLEAVRQDRQSGLTTSYELRLRNADGGEVYAVHTGVPRLHDRRVVGAITVITDLSERRRMEHVIRRERDFVAAVNNATNAMIVVIDPMGQVVQVNHATEVLTGHALEDLLGQPFWQQAVPAEERPRVQSMFAAFVRAPMTSEVESRLLTKYGAEMLVRWSAAPLFDSTNEISHVVLMGVDVTERRLAEREARRAQLEAERANRLKSEFLANVSHELRTPLHAINGFIDLLFQPLTGPLNAEQADFLGEIHQANAHLLELINDLLDLSKADSGNINLTLAALNVIDVLDSCCRLVQPQVQEAQLVLEVAVNPNAQTVLAGERQLKQIVVNLLSNAVKFTMPGGRVTLQAEVVDGTCEIRVSDNGIGMTEAELAMIFEPFGQAGQAKRERRGFGLGLTLAKRLAELHGGSLTVSSQPGEGSTFCVRLPNQHRLQALRR